MRGWVFEGQDLTDANLGSANLVGADLTGAKLTGVRFENSNLTDVNLKGADLSKAKFRGATLTNTIFDQTIVAGAIFGKSTSFGFTKEQLYSTASYQAMDLRGIALWISDLRGWDFSGQDLRGAEMQTSRLDGANFLGASLENANLSGTDLKGTLFDSTTTYNQWTRFPEHFNPRGAGMTLVRSQRGDLNADHELDEGDINLLAHRIRTDDEWHAGLPDTAYDINRDRRVDIRDYESWIKDFKMSWFGDANLDGQFDSGDLVAVFIAGEYENEIQDDSTWSTGDWNADGDFTTSDLVAAFQDGGYEQGPRTAARIVPEPHGVLILFVGLIAIAIQLRPRLSCRGKP